MSAKTIDEKTLQGEKLEEAQKLARVIKERYKHVQIESDQLEEDKKELAGISKEVFFEDLGKDDIHNNHDYYTEGDDRVRVNFKVKSRPITEISKKPAGDFLKGQLGEYFDKLFTESNSRTITASQDELRSQAVDHPECFGIQLKKTLTHEDLYKLVSEHPDWVEVHVSDDEKYSEIYPEHVNTETTVIPKGKFIESAEKMEPTLKTKVRGLMKAFLEPTIAPAVLVGQRSHK